MIALPSPQQLRYLVALAEHGHFGRAAVACAVTQSTLSSGIFALERQLDAALLERTGGKRPVFTPLGRELVGRARTVLAAFTALVEAVETTRDPLTGPLRLGTIPTIGPFLLPRLMPRLRDAFPRLREDTTERLLEGLDGGRLDLLLLALPCDCGDVESVTIAEDPFHLAMSPTHPLAALTEIPPEALARERLMLLEEGHCLREHALSACGLPAAATSEEFAATSLHTLVQMVGGGLGLTLLPHLAVAGGVTAGADVTTRPLVGAFGRRIALAWRARSPRADEFRTLIPTIAAALHGS
jgi:LysR family hydrogen peroxide-inducible transcriptional activator